MRHWWLTFLLFTAIILATRLPLAPNQLFTFDDVNLAYSIGHFDIRASQPQPPGYPLFVLQMRVLYWLRFRRPENILLALGLAGSVAALLLLAFAGDRILGGRSGFYAGLILALNPVFWHAGVVSALRVQLALVSAAVAAACWRAWQGDVRWVNPSAIILGLAAGIRPETGPLLFPLWAVSAWRARASWRDFRFALGLMAAAALAWLLPAMLASGGPAGYVKACLEYIADQASVTSGLFGSEHWRTTFWHLIVWTFAILPGCGMAAALAWRRDNGWQISRAQWSFLGLWLLPAFAFALLVHLEDPGQALGMIVVVAALGGYWIEHALDNLDAAVSRWQALFFAAATLTEAWIIDRHDGPFIVVWTSALGFALGLLLKVARTKTMGNPPRIALAAFLLAPVVILNLAMFRHPGWYYRAPGLAGGILEDLNSGLALTSLEHIRTTLEIDDHAIREVRQLAAGKPGRTFVVWEHGATAWRKLAYYAETIPIAVLEHRYLRTGSPPAIALWKGPRRVSTLRGATPLRLDLPAGARIVWLVNPRTDFYAIAQRNFPLTSAGSVFYTDLPDTDGARILGEYELAW
jgi:4-amino-4-deoxy-L-arabinose transferase-like glycosyltransferase